MKSPEVLPQNRSEEPEVEKPLEILDRKEAKKRLERLSQTLDKIQIGPREPSSVLGQLTAMEKILDSLSPSLPNEEERISDLRERIRQKKEEAEASLGDSEGPARVSREGYSDPDDFS